MPDRDYRSNLLRSIGEQPVSGVVAGALVFVEIGATVVHFYAHEPIELGHQAALSAPQPVMLPDFHQEQTPSELPARLISAVSTASASTSSGPISWFIPGGWPPST